MKIPFGGRILLIGCGSVSRCLQPLLLKHLDMNFAKFTIMDFADLRERIPDTLAAGVQYVQAQITPDTLDSTLSQYLGAGDVLIDLGWNIDTIALLQWCHDHEVNYINTATELWDPYGSFKHPTELTLYASHMAIREHVAKWAKPGATAIIEHGANPGLVSHWTKVALKDITTTMLKTGVSPEKHPALEAALSHNDYPQLAMLTGVKVIHISERDTQVSDKPKATNEFVNTWSIEGFREEGVAPAEMGWGTHERRLPPGAHVHKMGPGNQICLAQMGINTWVRSWVPMGEIRGMVVRHGEAFTISDYLTVWDNNTPIYRPTVHYAYHPADAAIVSLLELKMRNYDLQPKVRIMNDEITEGKDELGVLLLGHDLNGWWVGSQLDIHETRQLIGKGQNATTLQVAASLLGAITWMIQNPQQGFNVPDTVPHDAVLAVAKPYLGPCPSLQTDWTPLKNRFAPYAPFGKPAPHPDDVWQFETFLVDGAG
jgi:homospermidine synthase